MAQETVKQRRQMEITYFKQSALNALSMEVTSEYCVLYYLHMQGLVVTYHVFALINQSPLFFFAIGMCPYVGAWYQRVTHAQLIF